MLSRNYQKELEEIIDKVTQGGRVPKLLLHSCCAPCSSYVLEYLSQYFEITVYYYNPNIYPAAEYLKRVREQKVLIEKIPHKYPIRLEEGAYEPNEFFRVAQGMEQEKEGGERCMRCYELRLREAAKVALAGRYDYFTTSLSVSPLKNAAKLNEIGETLAQEYRTAYLPSDFKKKGGYQRSVALSSEYGLYRQDYCGCIYSQNRENNDKV